MWTTVMYAAGASLPLLGGAIVGVRWQPPQRVVATVLAFTGGALIVSTSFELFEPAYEGGGAWRAGLSFGAGALVFVVADTWLDRRTSGSAAGPALLAGVTLDGIPENTAHGVSLNRTARPAWRCSSPSSSANGGPAIALASAAGFVTGFLLSL
jgi:ZIP family zinc transporter